MRPYTTWHLEMEDNDEDYEGEYHKSAYDWRLGITTDGGHPQDDKDSEIKCCNGRECL